MTTKIRVKFTESSKVVSSETLVESDELSENEVLNKSRELMLKALRESSLMSMRKMQGQR